MARPPLLNDATPKSRNARRVSRACRVTANRRRYRARSKMKGEGGRKPKNFKSVKNMDKLIAAVQARECLWDKCYRGHRNRFKLERYWNEVAAEVGISTIQCRKRWKNLKDQCRKEMKKNPTESDWPHFPKLKFIHSQFLTDDEDAEDNNTNEDSFGLDETMKNPKLGYTIRKKFLVNKRRTIELDTDKLIELVQAKDIVWNRQLKGHHNWYKLDECWKEIAQQLGVTRDEARLKWKYLRDQTRKECRKSESDWNLFPKLQFLVNQFNDYEGNENEQDQQSDNDDHFNDAQESHDFGADPDEPSTAFFEEANVKETERDDFDEFDTKPVIVETDFYDDDEPARSALQVDNTEKDEDVGFFNSLLPHVKKLSPAKKLMLRMKIQELVYNTVYN